MNDHVVRAKSFVVKIAGAVPDVAKFCISSQEQVFEVANATHRALAESVHAAEHFPTVASMSESEGFVVIANQSGTTLSIFVVIPEEILQ